MELGDTDRSVTGKTPQGPAWFQTETREAVIPEKKINMVLLEVETMDVGLAKLENAWCS